MRQCSSLRCHSVIPGWINAHSLTEDPIMVLDVMVLETGRFLHGKRHQPHRGTESAASGRGRRGHGSFFPGTYCEPWKETFPPPMSKVLLNPLLLGGLALRPLLMATTLRLMTALFQHPNSSPLDDTIHNQPQDTSHHDSPQLCPLQPL